MDRWEEVEIFRENIKEKIFLKISIIKSDEGHLEVMYLH